jgi:phosphate transport system substrate-binding protein
VVPVYHLAGEVRDLRFTPEILAGIYLGKIRRWNDPLLMSVNRRMSLPARDIVVIHRSDASGTTYIWTDYLSKVSPEWRSSIGAVTQVRWPVGVSAAGSEGVAGLVEQTADSIGYVEFIYALHGHLSYGAVRNASGRFVTADLSSLQAAAATSKASRRELRTSITNAPGANAYPIAAFTYFIVPETPHDAAKAALMTRFLLWTLTSGQKQSAALGYAALPDDVTKQAIESVGALR